MGIEQESLGVPEEESSDVVITFSAKEFASIVNTLKEFSDSVRIDVDRNGVKFVTNGDIGGGEVLLKPREGNSDDDLDVGVDIKVCRTTRKYDVKREDFVFVCPTRECGISYRARHKLEGFRPTSCLALVTVSTYCAAESPCEPDIRCQVPGFFRKGCFVKQFVYFVPYGAPPN